MDQIKGLIAKGAGFLAILGFASIVLSIFNYNVRLLIWIDMWGSVMGWVIRIGLIVVGVALYVLLGSKEEDEEEETVKS